MTIERLTTQLQSDLPISNAVKAGDILYTSQIPRVPGTLEILNHADVGSQVRQTFENLKLVVEAAGGTMADVTQLTVFLIDPEDAVEMNRVYREFFVHPFPNRATVVVKALLVPSMKIEIMAQAYIPKHP